MKRTVFFSNTEYTYFTAAGKVLRRLPQNAGHHASSRTRTDSTIFIVYISISASTVISEVLGTSEIPPHSPRDNVVYLKRIGGMGCWLLAIGLYLMLPNVGFSYIIISDWFMWA